MFFWALLICLQSIILAEHKTVNFAHPEQNHDKLEYGTSKFLFNVKAGNIPAENTELNSSNSVNAVLQQNLIPISKQSGFLSFTNSSKFKLFLAGLCAFAVFCELLDECFEAIEEIPYFHKFVHKLLKKVKVKHGVLFLTLSHAIELFGKVTEGEELIEKTHHKIEILEISDKRFESEVEAAKAYDHAALLAFPTATANVNFKHKSVSSSNDKTSKYMGVLWDDSAQKWKIDVGELIK